MEFGLGTFGLGYLAGLVSTLSPCVLPLIPVLLAAAGAAHRLGPCALAAGLMLSFSASGLFMAAVGASLGMEASTFQHLAAAMLIAFAVTMLSARLQARFAGAASRLGSAGEGVLQRVMQGLKLGGLAGQFVIGLMLGLVWSPCVGPTLGAATTLASQGQDLTQIALLMAVFGIGAGTPMLVLGALSRQTVVRMRGHMLAAGRGGKRVLGAVMLLLGLAILTGADKRFEAWAVDASPAWLTHLTTRF